MSDFYSYAFIRTDLSIDQQIIQHGHACHDAAVLALDHDYAYTGNTPNLVLFKVDDEQELIEVQRELRLVDSLKFAVFYERDHDRGFTALTTVPIHRTDPRREAFAKYELYGRPQEIST